MNDFGSFFFFEQESHGQHLRKILNVKLKWKNQDNTYTKYLSKIKVEKIDLDKSKQRFEVY